MVKVWCLGSRISQGKATTQLRLLPLEERAVPAIYAPTTLQSSSGTEVLNLSQVANALNGGNVLLPSGNERGVDHKGLGYEIGWANVGSNLPVGYRAAAGTSPQRWLQVADAVLVYEGQQRDLYLDVKDTPATGSTLPAHPLADVIFSLGSSGAILPRERPLLSMKVTEDSGLLSFYGSQVPADPVVASTQPRFDWFIRLTPLSSRQLADGLLSRLDAYQRFDAQIDAQVVWRQSLVQRGLWNSSTAAAYNARVRQLSPLRAHALTEYQKYQEVSRLNSPEQYQRIEEILRVDAQIHGQQRLQRRLPLDPNPIRRRLRGEQLQQTIRLLNDGKVALLIGLENPPV